MRLCIAEGYWRCCLPSIRQEACRLLPALGPVRRSSFRRGRDNGTHSSTGFDEGCTILPYDEANAFNSIYRHRFLSALAEIVPSVVSYASNFQCDFLQEAVNGEPTDLEGALFPMEYAQASFQILHLSATSRLSHLLRTVPLSITC